MFMYVVIVIHICKLQAKISPENTFLSFYVKDFQSERKDLGLCGLCAFLYIVGLFWDKLKPFKPYREIFA